MKRPGDDISTSRKTLPKRRARKGAGAAGKPEVLKQPAQRKRILKKGSDLDLVKTFGKK